MIFLTLRTSLIVAALLFISDSAAAQETARRSKTIEPPHGMVLVPAGPFLMGNNNEFYDNDNDEKPRHAVNLQPFFMDIYPVTNEDYKDFVDETGHRYPQYWSEAGEISQFLYHKPDFAAKKCVSSTPPQGGKSTKKH